MIHLTKKVRHLHPQYGDIGPNPVLTISDGGYFKKSTIFTAGGRSKGRRSFIMVSVSCNFIVMVL